MRNIFKRNDFFKYITNYQNNHNSVKIRFYTFKNQKNVFPSGYRFLEEKSKKNYDFLIKRTVDNWLYFMDKKENVIDVFCSKENFSKAVFKTLGIYCENSFSVLEGFFLHSSSISLRNKIFVFVGQSGSGKTTIAELSKKMCFNVLSDESTFIQELHSDFIAWSTPFGQITDGYISGKIAGFFFLKQYNENRFIKLSTAQATYQAWSDSMYRTQIVTPEQRKWLFNQWFDMFSSLPCYEMRFTKDFDQWDKLIELCDRQ